MSNTTPELIPPAPDFDDRETPLDMHVEVTEPHHSPMTLALGGATVVWVIATIAAWVRVIDFCVDYWRYYALPDALETCLAAAWCGAHVTLLILLIWQLQKARHE